MSEELKPCPFCGSDELLGFEPSYEGGWTLVKCRKCGCSGPSKLSESEVEAAALWNTRPAPAEDVRAVVEEPVAWMSECIRGYRKGMIEQTDGPGSTHNIEYWTPDFPVYRRPQLQVVIPERREEAYFPEDTPSEDRLWNSFCDEFARLNPEISK